MYYAGRIKQVQGKLDEVSDNANEPDRLIKDASFRIRNIMFNCCDVKHYHSYPCSWRIGAWGNDSFGDM